ncbi:MAG: alpha/beta fold hydrolase [Chloroflexota bacterium]
MPTHTQSPFFRRPGLAWRDHTLDVPLEHEIPGGEQISIYAREIVKPGKEDARLPFLLFLQGGPGGKADRPQATNAWMDRALDEFRVLLLDQRGTGRSTPANRQTLASLSSPAKQADYLKHFRADSIVRDAELLRAQLQGETPWSILGQSFGGFCAVTYLSIAPSGLKEVFITGGLPPLAASADDVYRATYPRVIGKNELLFARYPADRDLARRVADHLREHDVRLPSGERLTPRRFQTLGITLGSNGRFETIHYLLEEAFVGGPRGPELSDTFLRGVDGIVSYASAPLYALVHEAIYCQGTASRWAADRVRAEFPAFDLDADQPITFTGEMIYPWFFDEDPALTPLREAANVLADFTDWPRLYDPARLASNDVPVAALAYHDDMYVDCHYSLETARAIRGARVWVTNQYEHDGLRAGRDVLDRLIKMARGEA